MGKNKMQEVSFANVDKFLDFLPSDELMIVKRLRQLIFSCLPDVTEKLSFNVLFYSRHRSIFFIWPASVLWGKKKTYSGVRFGFAYGHLIHDDLGYLDRGNRKQVYWHDFENISDIDEDLMRVYIFEAALIDDQYRRKRKALTKTPGPSHV
jgi:hypothetical protein